MADTNCECFDNSSPCAKNRDTHGAAQHTAPVLYLHVELAREHLAARRTRVAVESLLALTFVLLLQEDENMRCDKENVKRSPDEIT